MQIPMSASHRRLENRIEPLMHIDRDNRAQLLEATERIVQETPLMRIEGDALKETLQLHDHYGAVIYAKLLSETPGENHYDYCFPRLLHTLEDLGLISPDRTKRLIEPTSCNAGVSLAWNARVKGYETEIVIPETLPLARAMRVREEATDVTFASSKEGFIKGIQNRLRRRMVELKKEGTGFWCPNHSETDLTPELFGIVGEEINRQLPKGVQPDVLLAALGNGTTIKGITPVLQKRHDRLEVIAYEDADADVTLIGAGGRQGVNMKFVEELKGGSLPVQQLHRADWHELFEGYNRNKQRIDTIGCTSAAALSIARTIIQERKKALNILVMFYDKADRYGNTVVTDDTSVYMGNGKWSKGIELE